MEGGPGHGAGQVLGAGRDLPGWGPSREQDKGSRPGCEVRGAFPGGKRPAADGDIAPRPDPPLAAGGVRRQSPGGVPGGFWLSSREGAGRVAGWCPGGGI